MSYQHFAFLYDRLMAEAPYDRWFDFFERNTNLFFPGVKTVLDVACGTGEMTIRLRDRGYRVTGVDLSDHMLALANEKAKRKGYDIPFFQQNMENLEGLQSFDAAICFCDSLNYLQREEAVQRTFQSVYDALTPGGLFLFDVHSVGRIRDFIGRTFADNDDEISYIWHSFQGEDPDSAEHELTFFVYDQMTGQYVRYDELHQQRTFPVDQYITWLEQAGFIILSVTGDFTDNKVTERTERVFFTVQKRG